MSEILTFPTKGNGRIYTNTLENAQCIKEIIQQIDEFEFDYMPDDLIAVYNGRFDMVGTGKFEADLNAIEAACHKHKIPCGIIMGTRYYAQADDFSESPTQISIQGAIKNFYETGFWTKEQVIKYYNLEYLLDEN